MDFLREALTPKAFNKISYVLVLVWIFLGLAATGIFSEMDINEPRFDFDCDVKSGSDKGFIRRKCFDQYQEEINKLGIPPYAFIIVNFYLIFIVSLVYSQYVKSTVNRLESGHEDAEGERRNPRRRRRLFVTYLSQLAAKFALGIIFIVFLETDLFYPGHFPADFTCRVEKGNDSGDLFTNQTQSTLHKCFSQRARNKNIWIHAVTVVNGIFAFFAFVEILWIFISRAKKGRTFMDNGKFYADHLRSNSDQQQETPPGEIPEVVNIQIVPSTIDTGEVEQEMLLEHSGLSREELKLTEAIKKMKDDCLNITEKLTDLNQPFRRNPGEGLTPNHLNIDKIYVNVAMHEGRADHIFAKDRRGQLKEYPPDSKNCFYAKPEDVIDKKHKNVLVVGLPGIGKTLLSTIIARMWASGGAFNGNQDDKTNVVVVFLMKFRRFTSNLLLSLRELLAKAETVVQLDEAVWDFVINNASRVLFIFDGVDEFSAKEDIAGKDHTCYKNGLEEKMPVSALFNKLARGQLLRGLNIITTTRPTAVPCIADVKFDRTVEILGFTSEKVQEYVEKFTQGVRDAKDKIWGHIKSNMNLFSLCYIPENCFLICSCLLEIISVTDTAYTLPTRMTDIYAMVVKIFFFKHNRQSNAQVSLKDYMYLPFNKLPNDHKKIFKRLGEIAFKGVKQGRLLFESSEVSGLEDCGLLHRLPDVKSRFNEPPKAQYCFTHSTLQEFFASKHLAESLNKTELENFVSKHINDGAWQMVLQFVAGLLEADPETKSSNSDIFIKLLPMSTEEKSEREMMADHSLPETNTLTCWPAEKDKQIALNLSPLFKEAAKTQGSASREKDEEESKPVSEEEDEEIEVTSEESAENQVDDLTSEEEIEITSEDENEYSSSFREMDEGSIVLHRGKVVKEGTQWDLKQVAVHVIFPPDAVPEDRTLTLLRWNPHARCPPLLHHEAIVSDVIELSAVDSPGILHFNEAVTIVIPHCASNLKGYEVVIKTVVDSETNEWDDSVELEDVRTQDDIKGDHAGSGDVQDFLFPVAISKITQCSTFVVVCRLRSHRHTITSQESKLVWPEFPLARISFPQNAVPHDESVEIIVKLQEVSQKLFKNKQILPGPIMRITTPRAVEFLKPVTIQIPLSLGERYRRRDIDLSIVRVRVLFKESSLEEQEWKEITDKLGAPPRFDGNIITFEVTHFSNFWTLVEQFWNKLALRRGFDAVIDQTVKSEINKLDCVPKAASFLAFVPGGTRLREESQLRLYCVPTCKKREVQDDERKDDNVKMADGSSDEPMYFNDKAYMFLSEGIVTAISPERLRTFHVSFQDEPFLKSLQIRVEKRGDLTVSFYRSQEKDVNNRLCELEVPLPPQRADLTDEHKKCFDKVISLPEEGGEDLKHMRDRLLEETKTPSRERLEWLSMKLTLWEPLARRLGFSEGQIIGFHKDNEEWAKKALSMLLRWKQKKGSDATYAVLCAALSHELVGRKDLAEEVIKL